MTTASMEVPEPMQSTEHARSNEPTPSAEKACSSNLPKEPEHTRDTECTEGVESTTWIGKRSDSVDPITEPGCYVCNWSGQLIRVSDDLSKTVNLDAIKKEKGRVRVVTRISTDPFLPLGKARMIAANWDLPVRF